MTKEMKQYLETVVTSIVNEDTAGAKEAFHEYLRLKTQVVLGEKEESEDEGKKNPFAKKGSKDDEGSGSGDEGSGEGSGSGADESSGEEKKEKKGNPFAKKD